ncbi:MAG: HxsD-like protein [Nannocystaceae bacterium]|nr:HxsD-like protein [Myxococcales bacterium]
MSARELRFHRDIYAGEAVDEAVKLFSGFADFELREQDDAWIVSLTAKNPAQQTRLCGEFSNFALGLTIQRGGSE